MSKPQNTPVDYDDLYPILLEGVVANSHEQLVLRFNNIAKEMHKAIEYKCAQLLHDANLHVAHIVHESSAIQWALKEFGDDVFSKTKFDISNWEGENWSVRGVMGRIQGAMGEYEMPYFVVKEEEQKTIIKHLTSSRWIGVVVTGETIDNPHMQYRIRVILPKFKDNPVTYAKAKQYIKRNHKRIKKYKNLRINNSGYALRRFRYSFFDEDIIRKWESIQGGYIV